MFLVVVEHENESPVIRFAERRVEFRLTEVKILFSGFCVGVDADKVRLDNRIEVQSLDFCEQPHVDSRLFERGVDGRSFFGIQRNGVFAGDPDLKAEAIVAFADFADQFFACPGKFFCSAS